MDIKKLIDDHIKERDLERQGRIGSGKWKPSSFGQCYRRQYWNKIGEKVSNPPDERTKRVFLAGEYFHDAIQRLLPKHLSEFLCEDDNFKGFADIVTEDCVIDIKSQHSKAFWYMSKNADNILEHKFENWLQVGWYAVFLDKKVASLAFVSKDDLCIQQYNIPTSRLKKHVMLEVSCLLGIKELPKAKPRLYKQKDGSFKECQWCQFRDTCLKKEKDNAKL